MSNITIHPTIAGNVALLQHLQSATNSVATILPGKRYAVLVQNKPVRSATWLRAIGERAIGERAMNRDS